MSREDWLINEAGLTKYVSVPYTLEGPYSLAKNRARTDKLWSEIDIDSGVIALPDSYVSEKGLPEAMRFPWDNSKGIYFVNAYHNLHCLKKIYRALNEYDRGLPQSGSFPHIVHCLDALRQDVICHADDTPRYAVLKKETPTGGGQYRQCRDWAELDAWAKEMTACWRYVNSTDPNTDQLERFKYCPEGSPYLEKAKQRYPDAGLAF
ncbi:hypothetical protein MMC21_006280 [Puttea exsequens]|nr:hypothetical protein [Puttea exsequens]